MTNVKSETKLVLKGSYRDRGTAIQIFNTFASYDNSHYKTKMVYSPQNGYKIYTVGQNAAHTS